MSLEKITLKLGKKKIELTAKEFELLKQDMRELDTTYKWYWYGYQTYPAITRPFTTWGSLSGSISNNSSEKLVDCVSTTTTNEPIDFSGNVLAYTANG